MSDTLELQAYVGPDATLLGKLSFTGNVRVDGRIEGELLGGKTVVLGPSAEITGSVHAREILVLGARVEANLTAREAIELGAGSIVRGDVTAPQVSMDRDIEFSGRCEMRPPR